MRDLESAVQQQHDEFDEAQGGVSSSNQIVPHNINSDEDQQEEGKTQGIESVREEHPEIKEEVKEGEFLDVSLGDQKSTITEPAVVERVSDIQIAENE